MHFGILCVLLSVVVVVVQCDDDLSLLNELKTLDFFQLFDENISQNWTHPDDITEKRLTGDNGSQRGRGYNWNQCVNEFGDIAAGLSQTEFWAMQLVDSWGKLPSGILQGNLMELGSFTECLNLKRNGQKYESQYCLASISAKVGRLMKDDIQPRIPMPGSSGINFGLGMCFPQSCSPETLARLINIVIPPKLKSKISVKIREDSCQFEETPSELRTIDWITIGLLSTVLCLMIASTTYDIYCTRTEMARARLLTAFSVYTNGRSLLSAKKSKSKDTMECVHGIRVFSTQWVVLGHTYSMYSYMPTRNGLEFMMHFIKQYHSMYMLSAFISVDTFFMLSGLFVSYTMLKHLEKTGGRINVPVLYLHRFLRLTPLLGAVILICVSILRYASSGPRWPALLDMTVSQCENSWWKTLIYVQNYITPEKMCLGHSWYLAVDTQLFLISPFLVYGIYRFRGRFLYGLSVFVGLCALCTITTYVNLDYVNNRGMGNGNVFVKTYFPTHLRYSPWLVGLIFGAILLDSRKRSVRIPRTINLLAWFTTFAVMATVMFANYPLMQPDIKSTNIEHAVYSSFSRIGWALALSYIIYACVHGYGGPVNWFLSLSLWQPLSRLSYAIYIIHYPVLFIVMGSAESAYVVSEFYAYHNFLGSYVLTILAAILGSLAFESPIVIIEKVIFGDGGKKEQHNGLTPKSNAPNDNA